MNACAGCTAPAPAPESGDVRLVPLVDSVPTAACDDVHFGGVELFWDGRWGRICAGENAGDAGDFVLDAQVICRQLGFPFGTVVDQEVLLVYYDNGIDDESDLALVWASEVCSRSFPSKATGRNVDVVWCSSLACT